ncbi:hypothetical protein IF650_06710 [Cellulosimicrobium terreum]|nr:hypothetical protein [Cellulosimicrobium terreum]
MERPADSLFARARPRSATRAAVLALLAALLLGVPGAMVLVDSVRSATTVYEQVQVTATAEGTEPVSLGRRANWQTKDVRVVTVTLPDGSETTMRTDDLAVGDSATAYRDTGSGTVLEQPDRPALLAWAFSVGTIIAAAFFARAGVAGLRRRGDGTRPGGPAPRERS